MHKLCILGNSHVGSIKSGWDRISARWPDLEVSFFAQPGNSGLATVYLDGTKLTSDVAAAKDAFVVTHGREFLEVSDFDSFLIYGARARIFFTNDRFYSDAVTDAAISDLTIGTPAQLVLESLRKVTDAPIFVGHTPLLAARDVRNRSVSSGYHAALALLNQRHYSRFNAMMVAQPNETIVNGVSSDPVYSWGVPKLLAAAATDQNTPKLDNSHMDAAFGEKWLDAFFREHLSQVAPQAAARPVDAAR